MATLAGNTIASTYALLLKIDNTGIAGDGTLRKVEDGDATDSALSLSDVSIAVDATDKIFLDGGTHSYIHESAPDVVQIVAGGTVVFEGDTNSRISLSNNDSGTSNTIFGKTAGDSDGAGDYNVFIGELAGGTGTQTDDCDYNTAVGYNALTDITSGQANTCIGMNAGDDITDGEFNVIIGQSAGATTTSAEKITAVGADAMNRDVTAAAIGSVAVGHSALQLLTEGIENVGIGYQSLDAVTDSNYNTAVGHQSLSGVTSSGDGFNTAVGNRAGLILSSDGSKYNTLIGARAGAAGTTGFANNTVLGTFALDRATTNASHNVAIGYAAMHGDFGANDVQHCVAIGGGDCLSGTLESTASGTVAIGWQAMQALTSGFGNTAVGFEALKTESANGDYNTAIGYQALETMAADTDGHGHNTAVGYNAAQALTTATSSVAIGSLALGTGTVTGDNNVCIGKSAGEDLAGGGANVLIGTDAGDQLTSGNDNTVIGSSAMDNCNVANTANVAIGQNSMGGAHTGTANNYNVCVGAGTMSAALNYAKENVIIGYTAGSGVTTGDNNILIGNQAGTASSPITIATEDNQLCLGNDSIANAYIKVAFTEGSDIRDKTDIETLPDAAGLNFVNQMRPVTYKWDNRSDYYEFGHEKFGERDHSKKSEQNEVGFIAQEVKEIEKSIGWEDDHIVNTSDENKYKLMYSQVTPILVKAIQELSQQVEDLKAKIE